MYEIQKVKNSMKHMLKKYGKLPKKKVERKATRPVSLTVLWNGILWNIV